MKILIIANSKVVFGKELKSELFNQDFDVSLLDFESLTLYDKSHKKNDRYSLLFKRFKSIPKLSMFFRMIYIKKVMKENDFDIVNIHMSRWFYLIILPWLMKQKFVITFYGSDFYRTTNFIKNIQKLLYKKADAITFTNPLTKKSFIEYYKDYESKSYVCRFGLKTLDFIDKNRSISKKELKELLGYDVEKTIATCGYNSTKEQQHEKIIKNLVKLPKELLEKIQFENNFISVSRLQKWKRVDRSLDVYGIYKKHNESSRFIVIGDGAVKNDLEKLVLDKNIQDVIFTGGINADEVNYLLSHSNIFLSHYELSNVGNPLWEAINNQCLVVTVNNGDTGKIIKDNFNGTISDEKDYLDNAQKLIRLSKSEIEEILQKATKTLKDNVISWDERMEIEYLEVMNDIK